MPEESHRFGHPSFERCRRQIIYDTADCPVIKRRGNWNRRTTEGHEFTSGIFVDHRCNAFDFYGLAVQVENMRPCRRLICAMDECCGRVFNVLEIRSAAEADLKGHAKYGSLHGFSWIAGQAGIAIHSVHRQRPRSEAIHTVIRKINSRTALVSPLEDTIVRR